MTKIFFIPLSALALTLSACSASEDGSNDADATADADGKEEAQSTKIKISGEEGDSKFSIKADGFSMDVDLPQFSIDSDDFDLNNVSLYPGTKVTALNVEDEDGQGGKVTLSFVAPTSVEELAPWFEQKMLDEKFEVSRDGNSFSGKTDEGDPFEMTLTEKTADETTGKLSFSEAK